MISPRYDGGADTSPITSPNIMASPPAAPMSAAAGDSPDGAYFSTTPFRSVIAMAIDAIAAMPLASTPAPVTYEITSETPSPPSSPDGEGVDDAIAGALLSVDEVSSSSSIGALRFDDLSRSLPTVTPLTSPQQPLTTASSLSPLPAWLSPRAASPSGPSPPTPTTTNSVSPSFSGSPSTTASMLLTRLSERMRGFSDIQASLAASSARIDFATASLSSQFSLRQGGVLSQFSPRNAPPLSPTAAFSFLPPTMTTPTPNAETRSGSVSSGTVQQHTPRGGVSVGQRSPLIRPSPSEAAVSADRSPLARPAAAAAASASASAFAAAAAVVDRAIADSSATSAAIPRSPPSFSSRRSPRYVAETSPPRYVESSSPQRYVASSSSSPTSSRNNNATRASPSPERYVSTAYASPSRATVRLSRTYTPAYAPATTWFYEKDPMNAYLHPNFEIRSGIPLPALVRVA